MRKIAPIIVSLLAPLSLATPCHAQQQTGSLPWTLPANSVIGNPTGYTANAVGVSFAQLAAKLGASGLNLGPSATGQGDSDYSIALTDRYVFTTALFTAPRTWTLPLANSFIVGTTIIVQDARSAITSTNTLTIARAGIDTIDSVKTSLVMTGAGGGIAFTTDGVSNWMAPIQTPPAAGIVAGSGISLTGVNPTTVSTPLGRTKFASQYGQADWCANLVAAIADLGSNSGTIFLDDTGTVASACSPVSDIVLGANHAVQFVGGGEFVLSQTLVLGQGNKLTGVGGSTGSGITPIGVRLKWTGGTSKPMVKFFDASHSRLSDIGLNCNNVTGCIGIAMDSDNNPPTTENIIENFSLTGFHYGILVGLTGNVAISGTSCNTTPSQSGCSENDFLTVNNFQMFGNCADTTAEGIHVNSLNAIQGSIIGGGNIQCANIGVHIINMNDNVQLTRMNLGSVIGTTPTLFKIESGVVNGPDLINNESEAGSFAVVDSSSGGSSVYQGNQWNQPVLVNGAARITSMSNTGCGAGSWTVGGTAHIVSIGDNLTTCWTTSGSGTVTVVGN